LHKELKQGIELGKEPWRSMMRSRLAEARSWEGVDVRRLFERLEVPWQGAVASRALFAEVMADLEEREWRERRIRRVMQKVGGMEQAASSELVSH
jgi:hypothetical protein